MTTTLTLEPRLLPLEPGAIRGALCELAGRRADAPVIVTLYVALTVSDRTRQHYRLAARTALHRAAGQAAELPHDQREALRRDLARIRRWVNDATELPHARGAVLFVAEALDLFLVVPLPRVWRTRALVADRPRVAEALAAVEDAGRLVAAVLDRRHARFFEVTPYQVRELPALTLPGGRGGRYHPDSEDAPGMGEHAFHTRRQAERHRAALEIARHLAQVVAGAPCDGVVLAGHAKTLAALRPALPRELAAAVIGTAHLNPTSATPAEIRAAVESARDAASRLRERHQVGELEAGIPTGWAVNGAAESLRALAAGHARVLLVANGQEGSGFRCRATGRLVLSRGECEGEGEAEAVPDVVSEALDEALRQRVEVVVVADREARERVDGMAALLRFRHEGRIP